MNGFWDLLVRPALEAASARVVVEVGSEGGRHTRRLADWCAARGAVLHAVDPAPLFDPEELVARHPGHVVFHRAPSLDVLGTLEADAVLLDGDHNWYTVRHELGLLEEAQGERFPLVLLHDVAWPWGRRDLYYAPERIPAEFRQPHRQGGVRPGDPGLRTEEGFVAELEKAEKEGGPRNGVRTAVEDFLAESALDLRLEVLEADFGLGLLAPAERLARQPALAALFDGLQSAEFQARLARHVESRRLEDVVALHAERRALGEELARVGDDLGRHQAELDRHEVEVMRLRGMLQETHEALDATRAQVADAAAAAESARLQGEAARAETEAARAEAEAGRAEAEAARAEAEGLRGHARGLEARNAALACELEGMTRSRSWRLTAPLRRAGDWLRRIRGGPR